MSRYNRLDGNPLISRNDEDYSINHFELPLIPSSPSPAHSSVRTTHILVAHMRYINSSSMDDFKIDMAKIGEDPETQRWWKVSCWRARLLVEP